MPGREELPSTLARSSKKAQRTYSETLDSAHYGQPQLRLRTRQGTALVWLLRSRDTFFVAATLPDSTPYWGDDVVLSVDTRGDGGSSPQHDDFQWYLRRATDSSVPSPPRRRPRPL